MKFLFIGDSITDAFRKPEEQNLAFQLGNGYVFLIAAHLDYQHPDHDRQYINRGVSGETLAQVMRRWQRDVLSQVPDILTLLIGVNEVIQHQNHNHPLDVATFSSNLHKTLDATRKQLPSSRLVLLEPFLVQAGKVTSEWQKQLEPFQQALRTAAERFDATFIPLQEPFDQGSKRASSSYWSFDGIHPTPAGFKLIANEWLSFMEDSSTS